MSIAMRPHVVEFIQAIAALSSLPQAVWMIGSQANGWATDHSDTDLLVFALAEFLDSLQKRDAPVGIDCLVVPTAVPEGFGIVALEGIACGCVVIGTETGGLKDAIGPCGEETISNLPTGDLTTLDADYTFRLTNTGNKR